MAGYTIRNDIGEIAYVNAVLVLVLAQKSKQILF